MTKNETCAQEVKDLSVDLMAAVESGDASLASSVASQIRLALDDLSESLEGECC